MHSSHACATRECVTQARWAVHPCSRQRELPGGMGRRDAPRGAWLQQRASCSTRAAVQQTAAFAELKLPTAWRSMHTI
eukprot:9496638-Pyramimonas_sp.AAC.2